MDQETRNFLVKAGLSDFIDSFTENQVSFNELATLDRTDLDLIFEKKVGAIRRFLNSVKSETTQPSANSETESNSSKSTSHGESSDAANSTQQSSNVVENLKNEDESEEDGLDVKKEIDLGIHHWMEIEEDPLHQRIVVQDDTFQGDEAVFISLDGEGTLSVSDSETSEAALSSGKKRNLEADSTTGEASQAKKATIEPNVVEDYLQDCLVGRTLLKWREKGNITLEHPTRHKLCHEIINAELGKDGNNKCISAKRFEILAECICKLFPGEEKGVYYLPRVPTLGNQRAVQPKGILYDKYHTFLRFLRLHGCRPSIRPRGDTADDIDSSDEEGDREPSITLDIQWLETNSAESQQIAKVKWHNTANHRINSLKNSVDAIFKSKVGREEVISYLSRFKCLSENWGLDLLLQDFEHLYGGKYFSLLENWPTVSTKLIALAKKSEEDIAAANTVKCLQLIPTFFKQQLLISGPLKSNRKTWKPNVVESTQGFLLHVKGIADLEVAIDRMRFRCEEVKKTLQPFPVVVGISEDQIVDSYVVLDNLRYRVESPLLAFDSCFKIYHALHCQYPFQSSHSWLFAQRALYKIETQWDMTVPAVAGKLAAFNKIL